MPDQKTVRRALERAQFVIVQEAFANAATCELADLLLPATPWGEKEGTVTNSERRISRVRAAVAPAGEARHDWQIACSIGQRLAQALDRPQDARLLAYTSAEAIWNEHRESTRGRDLDITGLSYALLEAAPAQWPYPADRGRSQARLYTDGRFATSDGRARFAAVHWAPVAEERVSLYPFSLTTGRLRDQWHGMTRTGTAGRLFAHSPEPCVQLHPQDLQRLGLQDGDLAQVRSKRGSLVLPVQASEQLAPLQAFIAMHWGPEVLGGRDAQGQPGLGVNVLTTSRFCPSSKQPELKHAAVQITPVASGTGTGWSLTAMAWLPADRVWQVRHALQRQLSAFDFASLVPFADPTVALENPAPRTGLLLRATSAQACSPALLQQVLGLLALDSADTLRYQDRDRAQLRALQLSPPDALGLRALLGFAVAGDNRSARWLQTLLEQGEALNWPARQWLQASSTPPQGSAPVSRQVCGCLNVREDAIQSCLPQLAGTDSERLAGLQQRLQCGTRCGSCVPELKRLIRQVPLAA